MEGFGIFLDGVYGRKIFGRKVEDIFLVRCGGVGLGWVGLGGAMLSERRKGL